MSKTPEQKNAELVGYEQGLLAIIVCVAFVVLVVWLIDSYMNDRHEINNGNPQLIMMDYNHE